MTEYDRVKEEIAFEHYIDRIGEPLSRDLALLHWQSLTVGEQKSHYLFADQIICLDSLEIRADNQELPENPYRGGNGYPSSPEWRMAQTIYPDAQQDMLKANFVKVVRK